MGVPPGSARGSRRGSACGDQRHVHGNSGRPKPTTAAAVPANVAPTPEWHPATVPGDVHLDLIANKLIPDPFYRDNEGKLQWIENADWEYRKTIPVTADMLRHQHLDLVFDGLDAYCEVYLNDKLVLTADNMFRGWRVEAKPFLKAGDNQLRILFPSPIKIAEKIAAQTRGARKQRWSPRPTFAKLPTSTDGIGGRDS